MFYTYILQSQKDKTLYIGSSKDLKERLLMHNSGRITATKLRIPWKVIYYEAYSTDHLARVREQRLKHHGNAIRELKKRIGL